MHISRIYRYVWQLEGQAPLQGDKDGLARWNGADLLPMDCDAAQSWSTDVKKKDTDLKTGAMVLTKPSVTPAPIRGKAAPVNLPSTDERDTARFNEEKQLGNEAFGAGKFDDAVRHYSQCIILAPRSAVGPLNRSQALLKLQRYHEAEADASSAIELEPTSVKAWYRRALARKELRKYTGA